MKRTFVETLESFAGGGYANMRNATFNAKVTTHKEDGTTHELHLPLHRQASTFRKDLSTLAQAQGDTTLDSCWIQFQCGISTGPGGQEGYKVSGVIEALGHADAFYSKCYELGEKVDIYKATMKDGLPTKDVRKKGPHYMYHMMPLELDAIVPYNWFMIAEKSPIKTMATYDVEMADKYDMKVQIPVKCARSYARRTPVVADLKRELLKHMYNGADYYVYNALEDRDLDLLQVFYTGKANLLQDDVQLEYNPRTYKGYTQIVVQLMDYRTEQVVVTRPWTTPSTKVETINYMAWKDIYGKDCERDDDWSPSDDEAAKVDPENFGTTRKRHRTE